MNSKTPNGEITGPNLISVIGALSLQDHDDMTDCTRIATASADISGTRYTRPENWLDEYVRTLMFLGWTLPAGTVTTRTRHDVSGNVADFLVQSADSMKDAQQANAMIDTLDALRPHAGAMLYLDKQTRYGEKFQVIPSRYDAQGNLHIAVFSLELVCEAKHSSFLFWNWERQSAKLVQQHAYLKLDRAMLATQRSLIDKKLGEITMQRFALRKLRT